jgi:hypothetical protein
MLQDVDGITTAWKTWVERKFGVSDDQKKCPACNHNYQTIIRPERLLCGMCYNTEYRVYKNRDYKPPSTINFSDLDISADHFSEASTESLYRDGATKEFHNMVKNAPPLRTLKQNFNICKDSKQRTIESSLNSGDEVVANICSCCGEDSKSPRQIAHIGVPLREHIKALFEDEHYGQRNEDGIWTPRVSFPVFYEALVARHKHSYFVLCCRDCNSKMEGKKPEEIPQKFSFCMIYRTSPSDKSIMRNAVKPIIVSTLKDHIITKNLKKKFFSNGKYKCQVCEDEANQLTIAHVGCNLADMVGDAIEKVDISSKSAISCILRNIIIMHQKDQVQFKICCLDCNAKEERKCSDHRQSMLDFVEH